MDINRNQYFLAGLVLLFLGCQLGMVESFVLTSEFTQFLAERTGHPLAAVNGGTQSMGLLEKPVAKKTLHPPDWLGWALSSMGAVLILHSWGLKKPD